MTLTYMYCVLLCSVTVALGPWELPSQYYFAWRLHVYTYIVRMCAQLSSYHICHIYSTSPLKLFMPSLKKDMSKWLKLFN